MIRIEEYRRNGLTPPPKPALVSATYFCVYSSNLPELKKKKTSLLAQKIMFGIKRKDKDGDPRVARALDALDIKYRIDSDGDFQFGFELEDGRTQQGFIRSQTYEFMGLELREIFSVGLSSRGSFDARTANILLHENEKVKLGAWSVTSDREDNHLAIFTAKIAADLDGDELIGAILVVVNTADDMENRLSGRDDF